MTGRRDEDRDGRMAENATVRSCGELLFKNGVRDGVSAVENWMLYLSTSPLSDPRFVTVEQIVNTNWLRWLESHLEVLHRLGSWWFIGPLLLTTIFLCSQTRGRRGSAAWVNLENGWSTILGLKYFCFVILLVIRLKCFWCITMFSALSSTTNYRKLTLFEGFLLLNGKLSTST